MHADYRNGHDIWNLFYARVEGLYNNLRPLVGTTPVPNAPRPL